LYLAVEIIILQRFLRLRRHTSIRVRQLLMHRHEDIIMLSTLVFLRRLLLFDVRLLGVVRLRTLVCLFLDVVDGVVYWEMEVFCHHTPIIH